MTTEHIYTGAAGVIAGAAAAWILGAAIQRQEPEPESPAFTVAPQVIWEGEAGTLEWERLTPPPEMLDYQRDQIKRAHDFVAYHDRRMPGSVTMRLGLDAYEEWVSHLGRFRTAAMTRHSLDLPERLRWSEWSPELNDAFSALLNASESMTPENERVTLHFADLLSAWSVETSRQAIDYRRSLIDRDERWREALQAAYMDGARGL